MTHCRKCGVLDDVGEEVICEDCADKMDEQIRSRPLSEHDAEISKKERALVFDELKEIDKLIDVLEHDDLTSFNQVFDVVYAWRGLIESMRGDSK